MSGHSKWAKEKHGKVDRDRKKGNLFGKLSRAITMAVIQNGGVGDPEKNSALRFAIEKARENNMPRENIERAIEHAQGPDKNSLKEVVYEAFGPQGIALLIVATTDNPNRTHAEVKVALERGGGKLAGQGAVAYLFKDKTPLFPVEIAADQTGTVQNLLDLLDELDDVSEVFTNAQMEHAS